MDIRETVLRALFNDKSGLRIDIINHLIPFDNQRSEMTGVLVYLQRDGLIDIDNEFRQINWRTAGKYKPLSECKVKARLTPAGEAYCKNNFMKDDKPTVKIEVTGGQVGNINTGDIDGDFSQSLNNESTSSLSKPTTPDTTKPSPTNSIMKAISKRTIEIIVGIIILVGATLIIWKITGQV